MSASVNFDKIKLILRHSIHEHSLVAVLNLNVDYVIKFDCVFSTNSLQNKIFCSFGYRAIYLWEM